MQELARRRAPVDMFLHYFLEMDFLYMYKASLLQVFFFTVFYNFCKG